MKTGNAVTALLICVLTSASAFGEEDQGIDVNGYLKPAAAAGLGTVATLAGSALEDQVLRETAPREMQALERAKKMLDMAGDQEWHGSTKLQNRLNEKIRLHTEAVEGLKKELVSHPEIRLITLAKLQKANELLNAAKEEKSIFDEMTKYTNELPRHRQIVGDSLLQGPKRYTVKEIKELVRQKEKELMLARKTLLSSSSKSLNEVREALWIDKGLRGIGKTAIGTGLGIAGYKLYNDWSSASVVTDSSYRQKSAPANLTGIEAPKHELIGPSDSAE